MLLNDVFINYISLVVFYAFVCLTFLTFRPQNPDK